jgi:hypothetical protein
VRAGVATRGAGPEGEDESLGVALEDRDQIDGRVEQRAELRSGHEAHDLVGLDACVDAGMDLAVPLSRLDGAADAAAHAALALDEEGVRLVVLVQALRLERREELGELAIRRVPLGELR